MVPIPTFPSTISPLVGAAIPAYVAPIEVLPRTDNVDDGVVVPNPNLL